MKANFEDFVKTDKIEENTEEITKQEESHIPELEQTIVKVVSQVMSDYFQMIEKQLANISFDISFVKTLVMQDDEELKKLYDKSYQKFTEVLKEKNISY